MVHLVGCVRCESGILSPFGESSALALLVLGSLVFWWQFIWLCLPECHVIPRPTRATDPVGLSPTGLQPCRLPTRRLGRLSLRRPEASLHFFCPRLTPPLLPLSRLCSRRPRSQYSLTIPKSRVQQGKQRTERLLNGLLSSGRYPPGPRSVACPGRLPSNIERHVFAETRLTAYRLKAAA